MTLEVETKSQYLKGKHCRICGKHVFCSFVFNDLLGYKCSIKIVRIFYGIKTMTLISSEFYWNTCESTTKLFRNGHVLSCGESSHGRALVLRTFWALVTVVLCLHLQISYQGSGGKPRTHVPLCFSFKTKHVSFFFWGGCSLDNGCLSFPLLTLGCDRCSLDINVHFGVRN